MSSSERTPTLTTIAGTGKPRLIVNLEPFYSSEGAVTYGERYLELPEATGLSGQLQPGHRIKAYREIDAAPPIQTIARVLSVDDESNRIMIDGWTNGQPDCSPAPPFGLPAGAGSISPGTRQYRVSFIVDGRETPPGLPSVPVTITDSPGQIQVFGIPMRDPGAIGQCTGRRLYRTLAGGTSFFLLAELNDNSTAEYSDNLADSFLVVPQTEQVVPGFVADGWIIDLPRCQELTETFEPFTVVHRLFRGVTEAKHYGWKYSITLDYGKYLSADAFASLRQQLFAAPVGSLVLFPRRDTPGIQYNVWFDEPLSLSRYGQSPGYRKVILKFSSRELISLPGSGTGYGAGYGGAW